MFIWNIASGELDNEIVFHSSFTATTIMHPATYLNKVLVGSQEGELQLWNIRTGWVIQCFSSLTLRSLIHTFSSPNPSSVSPVTIVVQSPALDVVGVGYLDGTIRVFDISSDELVMEMRMDEGSITGLSFRMDGTPVLASSSSVGAIAMWDLNKGGRVLNITRTAHEQAVSRRRRTTVSSSGCSTRRPRPPACSSSVRATTLPPPVSATMATTASRSSPPAVTVR
jgi:U3 small nucleolar RNA-associated protein 21